MEWERYEETIAALGGQFFYDALRKAHEDYGKVLGITSPTQAEAVQKVRGPMDKVTEAIRDYALKVAAQKRDDKPESLEMIEDLLLPLAEWEDQPTGSSQNDSSSDADAVNVSDVATQTTSEAPEEG